MNSYLVASSGAEDKAYKRDVFVFVDGNCFVMSESIFSFGVLKITYVSYHNGVFTTFDWQINNAFSRVVNPVNSGKILLINILRCKKLMDVTGLCNHNKTRCLAVKSHDRVQWLVRCI